MANEGLGWDPLLKGTTPLHDFRTKHICAFLPMNHWNYDGYFPFPFNVGNTAFHFSLRGASLCVLGIVIFSTELHFGHFGQQISLHDFRFLTYAPSHARSILHVFQGTQGMLWGGLAGGVGGDVITSDGAFTHGRYYMFSMARTHTQSMRVASKIHLSCEFGGVPLPRLSSVFAVVSEQHRFLYAFCVLLF